MNNAIAKILVSEAELEATVTRLAAQIDADYKGSDKKARAPLHPQGLYRVYG